MATLEVIDIKGKKHGTHELSEKLTEASTSLTSVHRAVVAEEANSRQGTQSAKTRSDVRGGGRKPYKQKKTGNARQGSVSSPHYRKGGMALAVKPRDYEKHVNRKERRAAILTSIASQVAAGNVIIANDIAFETANTKQAQLALKAMGLADIRRVLIILDTYSEVTYKSFKNIPGIEVRTAPARNGEGETVVQSQGFSARDILVAHKILIAKGALSKIEEVWAK